ncbi:MAG: methionine adenosyltransferase, partial [Syntrophobacteraceae bacterium]|nr:methionine adenosyltransferase [Syntrophobacteraceae bacterium]
ISVRNQATVFGFACNQTPSLMPMPIWLAQKLTRRLTLAMRQGVLPFLAPDGKSQVGVEYRDSKPHRIHTITVSASLREPKKFDLKKVEDDILQHIVKPAFADEPVRPDPNTRIFVNPEGTLLLGGPAFHSGLTGRKNAVDTYGEYGRHSDSALSGKDPMRIDRVGPYAARYAAKNLVEAGLAEECEVQLSYSIGLSRPVSIQVDSFDTGMLPDKELAALIKKHFDFRLGGILKEFGLRSLPSKTKGGFFRKLAAHGHVGRTDMDLPWERTDKVHLLQ